MMDCEGDVITMVNNSKHSGQTYSIHYRHGDSGSDDHNIQMIVNNNKMGLDGTSHQRIMF